MKHDRNFSLCTWGHFGFLLVKTIIVPCDHEFDLKIEGDYFVGVGEIDLKMGEICGYAIGIIWIFYNLSSIELRKHNYI